MAWAVPACAENAVQVARGQDMEGVARTLGQLPAPTPSARPLPRDGWPPFVDSGVGAVTGMGDANQTRAALTLLGRRCRQGGGRFFAAAASCRCPRGQAFLAASGCAPLPPLLAMHGRCTGEPSRWRPHCYQHLKIPGPPGAPPANAWHQGRRPTAVQAARLHNGVELSLAGPGATLEAAGSPELAVIYTDMAAQARWWPQATLLPVWQGGGQAAIRALWAARPTAGAALGRSCRRAFAHLEAAAGTPGAATGATRHAASARCRALVAFQDQLRAPAARRQKRLLGPMRFAGAAQTWPRPAGANEAAADADAVADAEAVADAKERPPQATGAVRTVPDPSGAWQMQASWRREPVFVWTVAGIGTAVVQRSLRLAALDPKGPSPGTLVCLFDASGRGIGFAGHIGPSPQLWYDATGRPIRERKS